MGEIIVGTGLAALPFALIVFYVWCEAKENGQGFLGVLGLSSGKPTEHT